MCALISRLSIIIKNPQRSSLISLETQLQTLQQKDEKGKITRSYFVFQNKNLTCQQTVHAPPAGAQMLRAEQRRTISEPLLWSNARATKNNFPQVL